MGKKWRKSIFQLLPLDGRYFLTVALNRLTFLKTFFKTLAYFFRHGFMDMPGTTHFPIYNRVSQFQAQLQPWSKRLGTLEEIRRKLDALC